MLKLYLMEAEPLFAAENRARAQALVEKERSRRAADGKQESAQALSLAAGLLLAYAVLQAEKQAAGGKALCECKEEKINPVYVSVEEAIAELQGRKPVEIVKAPGGKPSLPDSRGLFFNLSHSGAYAACAISDREVGLDIQQCKKAVRPAVLDRVLHEMEKDCCAGLSEEEKAAFFFRIWAAKEAYVKCTGEGLAKRFSALLADWESGSVTDTEKGIRRKLYSAEAPAGYIIAVCTEIKI
ncbi:MAG: 4'-phosphopantetheinyl transferase superfamily protein [Lachnospiraceae bacterium]|nr:4'-phosphopantetheinyl transferase superfamily protein [Lachnospiraceae bacterium]